MGEKAYGARELVLSKGKITLLLVGIVVVIHLLNIPAVLFQHVWPDPKYNFYIARFSVRAEGKLGTYYSGLTLLAAAALFALIAKLERESGSYRHWFWMAVVFALMALDEVMALHDPVEILIRRYFDVTSGALYYAWVIPGMIFVALLAAAYLRFWWRLPLRTRTLLAIAAVVYVGGALGMEMVQSAYFVQHGIDLGYGVIASVEEILEMSGVIILLYTLMDYLGRYAPEQRIRFTD